MARTPRKANVYERKNFFLEIPRQDFAAEKSVILSQQQMIQNLQKMNRFVFGQLEGVVKEKAKIYGVESAPSIQQVKDINAHNERLQETEAFLEGKSRKENPLQGPVSKEDLDRVKEGPRTITQPRPRNFTTYDKVANEYFLASAKDTMSVVAKQDILALLTEAKNTDMSYDVLKPKMQGIIDGYTDSIGDKDVLLAKTLNSELSLFAYTKGQAYALDMIEETKKKKKANWIVGFETSMDNLEEIIAYSNSASTIIDIIQDKDAPATDEITARGYFTETILTNLKSQQLNVMPELGFDGGEIRTYADRFDTKKYQAIENIILGQLLRSDNPQKSKKYVCIFSN